MKQYPIKKYVFLPSFVALIFLCYFMSTRFAFYHSLKQQDLSTTTQTLLASFDKDIRISLFTPNEETHRQAKTLIARYQHKQPLISFVWQNHFMQNPKLPQQALLVEYANGKEIIDLEKTTLNEDSLSNTLFKLQRKPNEWVVMLKGHGEPSVHGTSMRDLSLFRQALENQGLKVQTLDLLQTPFIPDNSSVLIICSGKSALMPKEEALILDYLTQGKSLLWLIDEDSIPLHFLSDYTGVKPLEGTVVDLHGYQLGTPHPAITIIDKYATLPFEAPDALSAFPFAKALTVKARSSFHAQSFLTTHEKTWTEKNINIKQLSFEPENNEIAGPLTIGYILTKDFSRQEQRIVVIGNSRFLSNGTIENYGNLALGLNVLSWLHHDDKLLTISQPTVSDSLLHLTLLSAITIKYGFLSLSSLLLIYSLLIFYRRKNNSAQAAIKTLS